MKKTTIVTLAAIVLSSCRMAPEPLSDKEVFDFVEEDARAIRESRITVDRPISLYDAMAMALVNNLDYRVQLLEQAVAQRQFDVAKFDMYPKIRTSGGYAHRQEERASSSESVLDRSQSLVASTSEDTDRFYGDLGVSWNIIDFGVSYYTAKQEANKLMISKELRRKALHNLLVRIREAYWKAAASQKLKAKVDNVIAHVNVALKKAEKVQQQQLQPPLETLRFQRSLVEIMRDMKSVRVDLERAEIELYQLLNLPIDKQYELSYGTLNFNRVPVLNVDTQTLAEMALLQRPELREEIYKYKISYHETKKALLRLLPGIELGSGVNYDSNSFLVDQFWRDASAQITANLMDFIKYKSRKEAAEVQEDLAVQKRMAMQIAILSQVHLALKDYETALDQLDEAQRVSDIDEKIKKLVEISARNDVEIELETIKAAASAISTKLQEFQSYADFQNSFGRLLLSIGHDIVDIDGQYNDIRELSDEFEEQFTMLQEDDMRLVLNNIEGIPHRNDVNGVY